MKYLLLFLVLASCHSSPAYKAGDCIRIYTNSIVSDFYVREVFNDKYVLSAAFRRNGVPSYFSSDKYSFSFDEINDKSKKINCSEVD